MSSGNQQPSCQKKYTPLTENKLMIERDSYSMPAQALHFVYGMLQRKLHQQPTKLVWARGAIIDGHVTDFSMWAIFQFFFYLPATPFQPLCHEKCSIAPGEMYSFDFSQKESPSFFQTTAWHTTRGLDTFLARLDLKPIIWRLGSQNISSENCHCQYLTYKV